MKTGKITAKLRDAVPVCFIVEGKEVKRYKNIELPDELKEVEMSDFHFNVSEDGKITFEIHYALGVLPEHFPKARPKVTRTEKAAMKTLAEQEFSEITPEKKKPQTIPESPKEITALAIIKPFDLSSIISRPQMEESENQTESEVETIEQEMSITEPEKISIMEIHYNVTGSRRKELVTAVSKIVGAKPIYKNAPTFAFAVDSYIIDKNGTLTGTTNKELAEALEAQGFIPAA